MWLVKQENRDKLCNRIGPGVVFRARVHNLIAFNVPLGISPEDNNHRLEVCEANSLDPDTITLMKWIKPIHRRSKTQRTAHLIVTFNNADAANRAITNGLYICSRRCHVERMKREPTRCLKCQGWNHIASECLEKDDTCGNCTKKHRTNECPTPQTRCCVSCKSNDHASWDRECPTFIRKLNDLNNRSPENNLQYIPTEDSWTWTATSNTKITPNIPPLAKRPTISRERSQPPTRARSQPRRVDSYVPSYDSYVPKYDRSGKRILSRDKDRDWSDESPVTIPTKDLIDLMDSRPLDQEYINLINNEHSNGSTHLAPVPTIVINN
jgi:hypothetical protein